MKDKIKNFMYNNNIDLTILLVIQIALLIAVYVIKIGKGAELILSFLLIIVGIYCLYLLHNIGGPGKDELFLKCNYSKLCKKAWINQVNKGKREDKCPLIEFMADLSSMAGKLKPEYTYYMVTHEQIIKQIERKFTIVNKEFAYEKDLEKLRTKLETNRCLMCEHKGKCKLYKSETVKFYRIKLYVRAFIY